MMISSTLKKTLLGAGISLAILAAGPAFAGPPVGHHTHEVLTGVSVRAADGEWHTVETTAVTLASIDDDEIDWYVSTGEGRDKAGAYAVQGLASRFVERINGSYTNVVGLPIAAVWAILGRYLSRKSL